MKEFESLYRREVWKEFWSHSKYVILVLAVILIPLFWYMSDIYTSISDYPEHLIGEVNGKVTRVFYQQMSLDNPRVRRRVKIEIDNGDTMVVLNDTLQSGDELILIHWITAQKRDLYVY